MHQPAPQKMYNEPHIFVNDVQLKATDSFTYLGSTLSREANIDMEVNNRLYKANSAFGRLRKKVWDRWGISQETKLNVYMAVVLTVLLCMWVMDCVQPSRQKTQPLPYKMFADYFEHQVARHGPWHRSRHTSRHPQHSHSTAETSSEMGRPRDTDVDQLVGKRNTSRIPLRRPSQASTLISPTGKSVPRIDPCGVVWFIPEQEQQKHTGSQRLRKSTLLAKRDFTLPPASQPARHTHSPSVEECCRPELDWLATSAPTGSTKHDIIIIIEEVMVIIGNDGRTTVTRQFPRACQITVNTLDIFNRDFLS